ncbi:MAG: uroporphyrinogen decarboxylase family protein [Bacteroidaceae bacterium]|nr:uroporphyrinogen decarboxylase family protein [Bacteroidaceae bacterium]
MIEKLFEKGGVPVMPIMTHPGIELIAKKVIDAVTDGQVHYQAIMALSKAYPASPASTTIMDLSVEAEAFGAQIVFHDDDVPTVTGRLLTCAEQVVALQVPSLETKRVPQYLKAIELAVKELDKPLFGGCIGPFSLAGRLYDLTELMMAMYLEPDTATMLLDKCTEFIKAYCLEMKKRGASGVVMAEPASGLLSNDDCLAFSTRYVKRIVEAVQDDNFAVILHNCGNTGQCTDAMVQSGAVALHFGNAIDMQSALDSVPSDIVVMGNIDPVGVMKFGTPDKVRAAVGNLLEMAEGHKNFVLSTGCDVPPAAPLENIAALFER